MAQCFLTFDHWSTKPLMWPLLFSFSSASQPSQTTECRLFARGGQCLDGNQKTKTIFPILPLEAHDHRVNPGRNQKKIGVFGDFRGLHLFSYCISFLTVKNFRGVLISKTPLNTPMGELNHKMSTIGYQPLETNHMMSTRGLPEDVNHRRLAAVSHWMSTIGCQR